METKYSRVSLINIITNRQLATFVSLVIIFGSALILYRRLMVDWVASDGVISFLAQVHALSMGLPFYFLVLMYLIYYDPKSRLTYICNKISNVNVISISAYVGLIICVIAFIFDVPVLLGSWTTLAAVIACLLISYYMVKDKMSPALSLAFGIGIMGVWVGLWEIPYQWAYKLIYDLPQIGMANTWNMIYWETIIEIPLFGCGLWIIIFLNKKYQLLELNKWFWIFLSIYIALMALWIGTGLWVDVRYDWSLGQWVQTPDFNKTMMLTYKMSKVFMLFALIVMIRRNNEDISNNDIVFGH